MPTHRPPTILDVAAAAGVSKSVVSRVISGRGSVAAVSRERVAAAIAELGYRTNAVAQSLVSGRSRTVGLLVRRSTSHYYAGLLFDLQRLASADGYRLVATTGNLEERSEERALETLLELRVDGMVIGSGTMPAEHIARVAAQVPTVVVGRRAEGAAVDVVRTDAAQQGREAARILREAGHRSAGVVTVHTFSGRARTEALLQEFRAAGLEVVQTRGTFDYPEALSGFRRILAGDAHDGAARPSVLVPLSFEGGIAAVTAAREARLEIPGDVSVLALERADFAYPMIADITALSQPVARHAEAAWQFLRERLDAGAAPGREVLVPSTLYPGQTLGRAPAGV